MSEVTSSKKAVTVLFVYYGVKAILWVAFAGMLAYGTQYLAWYAGFLIGRAAVGFAQGSTW